MRCEIWDFGFRIADCGLRICKGMQHGEIELAGKEAIAFGVIESLRYTVICCKSRRAWPVAFLLGFQMRRK